MDEKRKDDENPIVIYTSQDGQVHVNAVVRDETLWLTQKAMAELFGVGTQAITKHLKNIYESGELQVSATCSKMEQVQNEGGRKVSREVVFYNLKGANVRPQWWSKSGGAVRRLVAA